MLVSIFLVETVLRTLDKHCLIVLVPLRNGIADFVGYLKPKSSLNVFDGGTI